MMTMPSAGPLELMLLLLVRLLRFGSTSLSRLARSIGDASRDFNKGLTEKDQPDDRERHASRDVPLSV